MLFRIHIDDRYPLSCSGPAEVSSRTSRTNSRVTVAAGPRARFAAGERPGFFLSVGKRCLPQDYARAFHPYSQQCTRKHRSFSFFTVVDGWCEIAVILFSQAERRSGQMKKREPDSHFSKFFRASGRCGFSSPESAIFWRVWMHFHRSTGESKLTE